MPCRIQPCDVDAVIEAQRALKAAAAHRAARPQDPARIESLKVAIHGFDAALERAYPQGFWEAYPRLTSGDPDSIEVAIAFLEDDPWFFRTGYVKGGLIRALKKLCLTKPQAERLREVVVRTVDAGDRPRFREFCHLARKVVAPSLEEAMVIRLASLDRGVARRARWVLDACRA